MRLAVGDIHGRDIWKPYLDRDFEEFYFTGDYFDSYEIPFAGQYRNFTEICAEARRDSRIRLCFGNHDYHYMTGVWNQFYSGYQETHAGAIAGILEENMDLLRVLYVAGGFIISHAGLSATFMRKMRDRGVETPEGIHRAFLEDRNILNFDGLNIFGDDPSQSPIWIRPSSLCSDAVPGYCQIVGHTVLRQIKEVRLDGNRKIAFIDTGNRASCYRF